MNNESIRTSVKEDIVELKRLWKTAFGDSDEYISWFFLNRYEPSLCTVLTWQGKIISVLYILPRTMNVSGVPVRSGFIAGAATQPVARGYGCMRRLLEFSLQYMAKINLPLAVLYPFSHEFYKKLGFNTCGSRAYTHVTKMPETTDNDIFISSATGKGIRVSELLSVYNTFLYNCTGHVIRDRRDMELRLQEAAIDGSVILKAQRGQKIIAYGFYHCKNGIAQFSELCWIDEAGKDRILAEALNIHKAAVYFSFTGRSRQEGLMAKVTDTSALINIIQPINRKLADSIYVALVNGALPGVLAQLAFGFYDGLSELLWQNVLINDIKETKNSNVFCFEEY